MLEPIVSSTRQRIVDLGPRAADLRARAADRPPSRDFTAALQQEELTVIAEIKRRSPSRGVLDADLDPQRLARTYQQGGAAAISVLTEPDHFAGSDADLQSVRAAVDIPVLRKDFTLDEIQVHEAAAIGADAILLIVALLSDAQLADLHGTATALGLAALVEVHTEEEAERARMIGPRVVGVNNRDLRTFDVDLATAERIAPILTDVPVTVGESGIFDEDDARRMRAAGFDAVLVGEALVRSGDPAQAIRRLRVR